MGVPQDVEETIKELKKIPGFHAYLILNNDGEENRSTIKEELVCCLDVRFFFSFRRAVIVTNNQLNVMISMDAGIVIKYENMSYRAALHHANQVLGLAGKASKYIKELFDAPDVSS